MPKLYYIPEPTSSVGGSMSSMPEMPMLQPAKEKEQPFLWSQALYLIARLLSTCVCYSGMHLILSMVLKYGECITLMVA